MSVRRLAPDAIQPSDFAFTAENRAWADGQIAKYPVGRQASAVIPLLWEAQKQGGGWVSRAAIEHVAQVLDMPRIRVLEVATFYTMFNLDPVGRHHVQLCGTTPCALRGAENLKKVCEQRIGPPKTVTADKKLSWIEVECLGACCNAPMVQINDDFYEDLTPESFAKLLDDLAAGRPVKVGPQNGRRGSEPEGAVTTLADATLFDGSRLGEWRQRFDDAPGDAPATPPPPAAQSQAAVTGRPAAAAAARPTSAAPSAAAQDTPAAAGQATQAKGSAARPVDTTPSPTGPPPRDPAGAEGRTPTPSGASGEAQATSAREQAGATTEAAAAAGVAAAPTAVTPEAWKPQLLTAARGGRADDLKLIWGVGPKLEQMLHRMGVFHFDQIAAWSGDNLAWVDQNLTGFRGRAARDQWIAQAKKLATGWRPAKGVGDKPEGL